MAQFICGAIFERHNFIEKFLAEHPEKVLAFGSFGWNYSTALKMFSQAIQVYDVTVIQCKWDKLSNVEKLFFEEKAKEYNYAKIGNKLAEYTDFLKQALPKYIELDELRAQNKVTLENQIRVLQCNIEDAEYNLGYSAQDLAIIDAIKEYYKDSQIKFYTVSHDQTNRAIIILGIPIESNNFNGQGNIDEYLEELKANIKKVDEFFENNSFSNYKIGVYRTTF